MIDELVSGRRRLPDTALTISVPGLGFALLDRLLTGLVHGRVTVIAPDGRTRSYAGSEDGPNATIRLRRWWPLVRLAFEGDNALAESYMAGEWDSPDLAAVLAFGVRNAEALGATLAAGRIAAWGYRLGHRARANTLAGSRRNIRAHYDLGNDFYKRWLDGSMTYSAALFTRPGQSLEAAQRCKYLRLARSLKLSRGDTVLEIGCGWGGFAEIAAGEFGCRVVALTLSREQAAFVRHRIARAGLADRVEVRLRDYRDVDGQFDKIASIEMFEAVGEENWGTYFETLRRRLVPGGRAALQVITIADEVFPRYRRNPDFIQRHIFPGGMLASERCFTEAADRTGLAVRETFRFGTDYAETLRRWHDAFEANWPAIAALGFDGRFRRMWEFYLRYCEVGFDAGHIDVGQYLLEPR